MTNPAKYNSDKDIVQGIRSNQKGALSFLYKEKYLLIEKLILNKSGTKDDAKDIYQESIMVFYNNVQKKDFKLTSSINTYLYSVAKNLWYKRINKRIRQKEVNITEQEYQIKDDTPPPIKEESLEDIKSRIIKETIKDLKDPCKTLLTKFYFQEQSMEDISKSMGYKSAKAAKGQKYKCMERLRKNVHKKMNKIVQ